MKRHEIAAAYERHISDLRQKAEHLERQKQQFVTDVYRLRATSSPKHRELLLGQYLRGRSYEDWIEYYDDHQRAHLDEISEYQKRLHSYSVPQGNPWLAPVLLVVLISALAISFVAFQPELTSFTVAPVVEPHQERAVQISGTPVNSTQTITVIDEKT